MLICKEQFPYFSLEDKAATVVGGIDRSKSNLGSYNSVLGSYQADIFIIILDQAIIDYGATVIVI